MKRSEWMALLALLALAGCGGAQSQGKAGGEPGHQPHHHTRLHEMPHRFENAEQWVARFEDPQRDQWQKPELVIEKLALARDSRVADIGSATGYFPVRIARQVPAGRVWGIDIEPDMVRYLNQRAQREKIDNLWSVLGTASDPLVPELVDRILVVDTYHHISDRPAFFRRAAGYLRPGGRVVIVDFKQGELPIGPPPDHKIPPDKVEAEMAEAGYQLRDQAELPYQFVHVYARE